jgi:AraC-like DNA-binding protein
LSATITTAHIDPARRSAHWHGAIAQTYFPLDLEFRDPHRFQGTVTTWPLGDVLVSQLDSETLLYRRLPRHVRGDKAEELLVTMPVESEVFFSQGGRDVRCGPGGYILERSHEPYEFGHDRRARLWVMKIRTDALASFVRAPDRFCSLQLDARSGAAALMRDMIALVPARHAQLEASERHTVGRQLVELLGMALHADPRVLGSTQSPVRAAHLARVERYVRANLHRRDLSPEMIAAATDVSVRYLHELFRDTGSTLGTWIREQRLDAARSSLETARGPVALADIAFRCGFADQASFSRSFKKRFGHSPRDVRLQSPMR